MSGDRQRVAVTGLGALSPGGVGVPAYRAWRERGGGPSLIPDFEPGAYVGNPKLLRSMNRSFQVVAASAALAMREAGLGAVPAAAPDIFAPERAGIAAALGDMSPLSGDLLRVLAQVARQGRGEINWGAFAELSLHELHPFRRLTLLANMAAAHTSLLFGLQGPSYTFTSGAAAGAQTVVEAYWTIAEGRADLMLCQAADCPAQAFTPEPRPELGGAMVLELRERSEARGAAILAELAPPRQPVRFAPQDAAMRESPAASLLEAVARVADLASARAPVELDELWAPLSPAPRPAAAALREAS